MRRDDQQSEPHPPAGGGRIDADLACVHCGYNLRTLASEALCPECGRDVGDSSHRQFLRNADPRWAAQIARGAGFLLLGGFFVPSVIIGISFASFVRLGGITIIAALASAMTIGVPLSGLYVLTKPEPGASTQDERQPARRRLRWAAGVGAALCVLAVGAAIVNPDIQRKLSSTPLLATGTAVAALAMCLVLVLLTLRHLVDLMTRIPAPGLVQLLRCESWAVVIGALALAAGLASDTFGDGGVLFVCSVLYSIIVAFCGVAMLVGAANELTRAAEQARRNATDTKAP